MGCQEMDALLGLVSAVISAGCFWREEEITSINGIEQKY